MKKFKFQLETLLQVRQEAENAAYRQLIKAQEHLKQMLQGIEELEKEYIGLVEEREKHQKQVFHAVELSDYHDYLIKLEQKIKWQIEKVVKAQIHVEDMRLVVVQAVQQKKILENLQQKQRCAWKNEYQMREGEFYDEISSLHHLRIKGATFSGI